MFANIKKLMSYDNYQKLRRTTAILTLDALFHGGIYSMLFLVLINLINDDLTKGKIQKYTIIMAILIFIRFLILKKGYYDAQTYGAEIVSDMRIKMGDYIKKLNMGFFNKNNIGEITNIITNDLNDFEMYITHQLPELVKSIILAIYLSIIIVIFEPLLGLIQVLIFIGVLPVVIFCSRAIKKRGYILKSVRASMISRIIEYIKGIEVFKSYNMVGDRFKNLENSLQDVRKESIKLELSGMPYILPLQVAVGVSFPIVLILAVNRLVAGIIGVEQLITFTIISLAYSGVLLKFSGIYVVSRYFSLSVDKLLSILELPQISYELDEYEFSNYDIKFTDVKFEYIENKPVINNISFMAKEGEMTALVGASGSGKSTIMNLIARFWDIQSGKIEIGGMDIKKVNPEVLLRNISMVFQNVYLLEDTILENIRIGNQNATKEEVIEAAKRAYCHEFITELENGYDTIITEGGDSLSGGEKQRISIARAFLKDAPILLLDEATASLDVDNEYLVQRSFRQLIKDKTVIVIAHRLNTIKDSNKIIVFDEGRIIESGSHEHLMNFNGKYAHMYTTMCEAKEWSL